MAKESWTWDNAKYKAKEWVNGKWKYIYNTAKNTSNKVSNTVNEAKSSVRNAYNQGRSSVNTAINNSKQAINTAVDKTKEVARTVNQKAQDVKNNVTDKVNAEKQKYNEQIKQRKEEIKKDVEENIDKKGALPALAIVGIAVLGIIASKVALDFILTAIAIKQYNDEMNEIIKEINTYIDDQRNAARNDNAESKATNPNMSSSEKDAIARKCNPNYDPYGDPGYSTNCYSCSIAYDMNRRGIECEAVRDEDGEYTDWYANAYIDPKRVQGTPENPSKGFSKKDTEKFCAQLLSDYPDGAYGNLGVVWTPPYGSAGGHSIVWEIDNGEVVIRDCQSGEIYKGTKEIHQMMQHVGSYDYFRADNLEINESIMRENIQLPNDSFKDNTGKNEDHMLDALKLKYNNETTWDNADITTWDDASSRKRRK